MPLRGILHPEKGPILFENVLTECEDLAPIPLIWNIVDNQQQRGTMISASMIGSCPKKCYLERTVDYFLPLEDLYWASFRGSLRHLALARYAEEHRDFLIEQRFFTQVDGVEISGAIDAYDPVKKVLLDWKTTKFINPRYLPSAEHLLQVAIYRLLLERNWLPVENIQIVYLDASGWAEVNLGQEGGSIRFLEKGQRKIAACNITMQSLDETQEAIRERVSVLYRAFTEGIEPPAEPGYLCNLKNREKKSYCPVRGLCSYWGVEEKEEAKAGELVLV